ncbi:ABC-type transport system involved in multi-copper enzyme maturation permease subunit [Anaerotaenia torta]|uniref:ABC transporter permease subunit n=1 Tax=Anaerotaenia torta TaxID=433293 RepID=UPI003D22DF09
MSEFRSLVRFEYKKILMRKGFVLSLILVLLVILLSCSTSVLGNYGINNESNYEGMKKDRAYARALSGRKLDADLILEAAGAYARVPGSSKRYSDTEDYQSYARPYSSVFGLMGIYNNSGFGLSDMQNMTPEQALSYYDIREAKLKKTLEGSVMNHNSLQKLLRLEQKVQKPFVLEAVTGYEKFLALMYTAGFLIAFVIAVCLSPLFAGEYASGTDQLILPSKNGKRSLIAAKILTGLSAAILLCALFSLTLYLGCMIIYGFDGFTAQIQLLLPMSPYPLTIGGLTLLLFGSTLAGSLLLAAITMLLSARLKSPFGVIIIMSIFIIAPMFISIPPAYDLLDQLFNLLPMNMVTIWGITSTNLYEILGLSLEPYLFRPIFAVVMTIALLPFAYKIFKNHQVR